MAIRIQSFGFLHGFPEIPEGALVVDLRTALRNPADDKSLIEMTGIDTPVVDHVLATPGAFEVIVRTVAQATALLATDRDVHVLVGCQGGRHRSVVVADQACVGLLAQGIEAHVEHLHITRPVVRKEK